MLCFFYLLIFYSGHFVSPFYLNYNPYSCRLLSLLTPDSVDFFFFSFPSFVTIFQYLFFLPTYLRFSSCLSSSISLSLSLFFFLRQLFSLVLGLLLVRGLLQHKRLCMITGLISTADRNNSHLSRREYPSKSL